MKTESVLFFLKPEAAARRATAAEVISQLLQLDLTIGAFCELRPPRPFLAKRHYAVHVGKPFHPWLVEYVSSGPVDVLFLEGVGAVSSVRTLLGATFPEKADPNSIRGRFGIVGGLNVAHASDSPANGETEIALWRPLIEEAEARSPRPLELAHAFIERYSGFERVETEDYREVHESISDRRLRDTDARSAFARLLARESDLDLNTLAAIAAVMVANATRS